MLTYRSVRDRTREVDTFQMLPQSDLGSSLIHFSEHSQMLIFLNTFPLRIDRVMGDPRCRRGVNVTLLLTVLHPKQETRFSVSDVTPKSIRRWRSKINYAFFALAFYEYLPSLEINLFHTQVADLNQSASGSVQQFEQSAIAQFSRF